MIAAAPTAGRARPARRALGGPQAAAAGRRHAAVGEHGMHPVLQRGRPAHQGDPVAQQRAQITHGLRRDPGLGQQIGAQQLRQGLGVDLVVVEPCRVDRLAATGSDWVDQVRLKLEVVEQVDQPAPAVGGSNATGVPAGKAPRMVLSSAGSLGRLRLRWTPPAWSRMATCERLRCTSIPTYILIEGLLPCAGWSQSLWLSG
jgi:hypothetical protein